MSIVVFLKLIGLQVMNENWKRFECVLRGVIPDKVPFTHTWCLHDLHVMKVLGRPISGINDEIEYRSQVGLPLGVRVSRGSGLSADFQISSDGSEKYVQGSLKPGSSLKPYEDTEDISKFVSRCKEIVQANHDAGLAAEGLVTSCIHALSTSLGLEGLSFAIYENWDWLEEAMELVERRNRRTIAAFIDAGVDIVLFDGDCAYKGGPMISPEMLEKLWYDRTKNTVSILHDAGIWAYYHTDGKVDEVLPMLISLGFAAFHGCEKVANSLSHLKNEFGDKITLIGNFDQAELTNMTVEQVVAETKIMLEHGAPYGRFIADLNTSVREFIPLENYNAFLDTICRFGTYGTDGRLISRS